MSLDLVPDASTRPITPPISRLIPRPAGARTGRARAAFGRRYLMCAPTYFEVSYSINPWMRPGQPVDRDRAMAQWANLRATYERLGHRVDLIEPVPGLPDMVFAANGGVVVEGYAMSSRFRHRERAGEERPYHAWLKAAGAAHLTRPRHVLEGEGDVLTVAGHVLVGSGFRTDRRAAAEVRRLLATPTGRRMVPLELVDPRYYHLDTALGILDDRTAAYLPEAFSPTSRAALAEIFPELVECSGDDAGVLGLNVVSDGLHVVLEAAAEELAHAMQRRGFLPIPVDMSELRLAGGSVKCCTLELRGLPDPQGLPDLVA